jgi:molybdopterin molybdotransferase
MAYTGTVELAHHMKQLVTPDEALQIVLDNVFPLPVETVWHEDVLGRTLARDIVSDMELPPFDNSAMDGYAVVAADTDGASETSPVGLRVLETVAAGAAPVHAVNSGCCAKIMTGAMLSKGADAVIMREEARQERDGEVLILTPARPDQNIRRAGSDVASGEVVLHAGTLVRAAEWGMLASLNRAQVEVGGQPRAGIITTGDELVAIGSDLQPGQIRDSNSFTIRGLLATCGATLAARRNVGDDPSTLQEALHEFAANCDAIITSGGVSVGDFDPVRDVLPTLSQVHFWKIAMKPGKPVMFATISHDGRVVPIFGLPGNPVSVMVAFEQFVRPALLKMQGRCALRRVRVRAQVDTAFKSPVGRVEFVRARVAPDDSGEDGNGWRAYVAGEQGSGRLSTMTRANALLVVPAEMGHVEVGTQLAAEMTDWPEMD